MLNRKGVSVDVAAIFARSFLHFLSCTEKHLDNFFRYRCASARLILKLCGENNRVMLMLVQCG